MRRGHVGLWAEKHGVDSPPISAMALRSRFRVGSTRTRINRFAAIVCAFAVLLLAPSALASAPMCDENGQTIEAPLPLVPAKGGEIRAMPSCELGFAKLTALPFGERMPLQASGDGLDRVLPWNSIFPPLPSGDLLPIDPSSSVNPTGDLGSGVYRPPRR
jgi:hypothetical protein